MLISGGNGTIDGQGGVWWDWFKNKTLNYTRPHLVEFMYSTEVVISNITFVNSPFWAIHPVYCRFVACGLWLPFPCFVYNLMHECSFMF